MSHWSVLVCILLTMFQVPCFAHTPKYIWNLGLATTCDVTPLKNALPSEYHTWPTLHYAEAQNYVRDVKDGDIIWLQSHQVANFYHNVLPTITERFILLINDGDDSFPSSYRARFDVDALINDPRVIHIFVQNIDTTKLKKVSGMPIGIDFHTVAHSYYCTYFGESQTSVQVQEQQLDELLATLSPTDQRIKKAYVDFQLADRGWFDGESRTSIFYKINPTGLLDAPSNRMPRHQLWQTKGQYAFSISPRGVGLDCHRTWEDLVLGCIVIVKTSSLDPLYAGLPVVIVKDWSEVTPENFDIWLKQYGDAFTNPSYRERLTHAYWMNKMISLKKGAVNPDLR